MANAADIHTHFNGIDAATGLPLAPSRAVAQDMDRTRRKQSNWWARSAGAIARMFRRIFVPSPYLGADPDLDLTDPRDVGWAVVVASDAPPAAIAAARRLWEHRLQVTRVPEVRCKSLLFPAGCPLPSWLRSQRAHSADIRPNRLPYYLLLVGSPESISFEAQTSLSANYAVGRIWFDNPDRYEHYVDGLLQHERSNSAGLRKDILFWAPQNQNDPATRLSAKHLVEPLFYGEPQTVDESALPPIASLRGYQSSALIGELATRVRLLEALRQQADARSRILFTASHGLGWNQPHPEQFMRQGDLVGQDWAGWGTPPKATDCLTAADLANDVSLRGLVAFLFACYGAGSPANDYYSDVGSANRRLAEKPFISALAQQMLAHSGGSALAVIGHVDRALSYSIAPPNVGNSLLPFRSFLSRVMSGEPVGHAMRDFADRYKSASIRLLEEFENSQELAFQDIAFTLEWYERIDARNYVVLGDPAARLS